MEPALGLDSGVVRVVPYDERWPVLFARELERLRTLPGALPLTLEHTGSTAVPGLAAKPVLDILAGYDENARVDELIAFLVRAGYEHRGSQGIPGREFFRRGKPRAYHVHLTRAGSTFWRDHLAFRDALRADAGLRAGYDALKRTLAARHPRDREAYIGGKTDFVERVLRERGGAPPSHS